MRRYSHYNKNDTYLANLNHANAQKERRNKEELKEIEQDRIAMKSPQTKENMNIKVGNEQDLFENQVINSKWKIYV